MAKKARRIVKTADKASPSLSSSSSSIDVDKMNEQLSQNIRTFENSQFSVINAHKNENRTNFIEKLKT